MTAPRLEGPTEAALRARIRELVNEALEDRYGPVPGDQLVTVDTTDITVMAATIGARVAAWAIAQGDRP